MRETMNNGPEPGELSNLRGLSARLGSDRLLAQASSGNTSMKIGGVLWIKASGKWLVDATSPDFFVPVQLARAKECLHAQTAIPETSVSGASSASIETAMHAVLPHKVIVHVHSVNVIAWAVREDAPVQLQDRLDGFAWQWIPYTRSGADLAQKIAVACRRFPHTNVLVLGNHGLVVCGESCDAAEKLLNDVERCVALEVRDAQGLRSTLTRRPTTTIPELFEMDAALHALAADAISRRILSGGVLYPCQAMFLPSTVRLPENSPLRQLSLLQQSQAPFSTDGDVMGKAMAPGEREMLFGLTNVVQRIDASAKLRYLSFSEVLDLTNADNENYLRAANRSDVLPHAFMGV